MKLVFNHSKEQIQTLTTNLVPKKARFDTLEGKQYLVVPMVILAEGVHAGSGGPLYYPPEELSKTPQAWNYKPIVVYHPEMNGEGISACDPSVINARKVGVMMGTTWDKGRLKSEAWIDPERANLVDERIMAAIEKNEMMELSTGVFVDVDQEPGEWKKEPYIGIARNYRPDHLALLPDKIGACSIEDGAGFLRNQSNRVNDAISEVLRKLLSNELSHDAIRTDLQKALHQRFPSAPDGLSMVWIENVYSNFLIYEKDRQLFRIDYTTPNDMGVKLSEDAPVEVKRVIEYRTLDGTFVGNQNRGEGENMNKKELINAIISNAKSGFKTEDEKKLDALSEPQLQIIVNGLKEPEVPKPAPVAPPAPAPAPAPAPVANEDKVVPIPVTPPKPVTAQDYVQSAPKEIQEMLRNGLDMLNEEKAKLVEAILANVQNEFSKEDLSSRPLGELRRMARLAAPAHQENHTQSRSNYAGQGHVPTGNREEETPLVMPVMDFDRKTATR